MSTRQCRARNNFDNDFRSIRLVDPLPWQPWTPEILPPDGGGGGKLDPEEPVEKVPCVDSLKSEANPLMDMKISDDNKSWRSNTWGYVRNNGTKFHDGLDLLGEPGVTSVYSMYSGKVTSIVFWQPNRIGRNKYPADYKEIDINGAGNRITIESTLTDGRIIQVSYWHLDVVEKNSYTQKLKIGDNVNRGQIIGIVGTSGNAYNKKPHLHLKTYIVGSGKENAVNNPFPYLYTKFDSDGKVSRDC